MTETKWLSFYAQDLDRKNFDAFLQGWCLSASSFPVSFEEPRYATTRDKLRQKMLTIKSETLTLLLKTVASNQGNGYSINYFLRYLPKTLSQEQLEILWENKCYTALADYHEHSVFSDVTKKEREEFHKRCFQIYITLKEEEEDKDTELKNIINRYINHIDTDEQFDFLFKLKHKGITQQILKNSTCPLKIFEACKDKKEYAVTILNNDSVPDTIALYLIEKFPVPVTPYTVRDILGRESIQDKIVVTVRTATEEEVKNKLTLKDRLTWWNSPAQNKGG